MLLILVGVIFVILKFTPLGSSNDLLGDILYTIGISCLAIGSKPAIQTLISRWTEKNEGSISYSHEM